MGERIPEDQNMSVIYPIYKKEMRWITTIKEKYPYYNIVCIHQRLYVTDIMITKVDSWLVD